MARVGDGFLSKPRKKDGGPDFGGLHFCPAIIEAGGKLTVTAEATTGPFEQEVKPLTLEVVKP